MKGQKACCQFSSDTFSGFKVEIDITKIAELDDIVKICRARLLKVLSMYNFERLIAVALKCQFHIHQPESLEQIKANPHEVIWICDHIESVSG